LASGISFTSVCLAISSAKDSTEYKELELAIDICCAIKDKKSLEAALDENLKYSKKYGVMNVTQRGELVEQIKRDDITMAASKREYKKAVGKLFNEANCKAIDCEAASTQLSDLAHNIALKSMSSSD